MTTNRHPTPQQLLVADIRVVCENLRQACRNCHCRFSNRPQRAEGRYRDQHLEVADANQNRHSLQVIAVLSSESLDQGPVFNEEDQKDQDRRHDERSVKGRHRRPQVVFPHKDRYREDNNPGRHRHEERRHMKSNQNNCKVKEAKVQQEAQKGCPPLLAPYQHHQYQQY